VLSLSAETVPYDVSVSGCNLLLKKNIHENSFLLFPDKPKQGSEQQQQQQQQKSLEKKQAATMSPKHKDASAGQASRAAPHQKERSPSPSTQKSHSGLPWRLFILLSFMALGTSVLWTNDSVRKTSGKNKEHDSMCL
jgi:hypothetical protein